MFVKSVRDVVAAREIPAVQADVGVRDACELMDAFDIGALLVLEGPSLVGILSERDVVRRCVLAGYDPVETPVSAIMTGDPATVQADQGLADAIAALEQGGFRHLPVMDGETPIGLLSIRDVPVEYLMLWERFHQMKGS
ncbi:CBS domain-containing protein [Neotabrizicola shimadae]|uniref:CBS domain-containing protein n=1 Tax=Neotabrizicola shimadae TaxID=2807096 RepID=A0A8G0ZWA2_9RHOB|nr:CBS domain-containing protein [Neotabrizicola shimadae]QYZ71659.1 CBS domain-containing protein [Neotabrizicola shimadae]